MIVNVTWWGRGVRKQNLVEIIIVKNTKSIQAFHIFSQKQSFLINQQEYSLCFLYVLYILQNKAMKII